MPVINSLDVLAKSIYEGGETARADSPESILYFRLLKHNAPSEANPKRSGRKQAFPSASDVWPVLGPDGAVPVQAVVAALRAVGAMPAVFTTCYYDEEVDKDGRRGWRQLASTVLGEVDIDIGEGVGDSESGDKEEDDDINEPLTSGERATIADVFQKREIQFQKRAELELKHDDKIHNKYLDLAERLSLSFDEREKSVKLAEQAVQNQIEMANATSQSALKNAEISRRLGAEVAEQAKTSELLAQVHARIVQTRVLPPPPGTGPFADVLSTIKEVFSPFAAVGAQLIANKLRVGPAALGTGEGEGAPGAGAGGGGAPGAGAGAAEGGAPGAGAGAAGGGAPGAGAGAAGAAGGGAPGAGAGAAGGGAESVTLELPISGNFTADELKELIALGARAKAAGAKME